MLRHRGTVVNRSVIYYRLSNTAVGMMMETNLENNKYATLRNHLLGFIYHPFVQEWYSMKKTEARHLYQFLFRTGS